uniref:Uncharacterized protein n=1 Tax=Knipowitschia caucasica TaxID=637954 RepID=A0AAV2KEW4_KNICA
MELVWEKELQRDWLMEMPGDGCERGCRFHYGPVAQVRSFQEQRGDLITARSHYWPHGQTPLSPQRAAREGGDDIYNLDTRLTRWGGCGVGGGGVNCNLPSKTAADQSQRT